MPKQRRETVEEFLARGGKITKVEGVSTKALPATFMRKFHAQKKREQWIEENLEVGDEVEYEGGTYTFVGSTDAAFVQLKPVDGGTVRVVDYVNHMAAEDGELIASDD